MKLPRDQRERLGRHLERATREWAATEYSDGFDPLTEVYNAIEETAIGVVITRVDEMPYRLTVRIES